MFIGKGTLKSKAVWEADLRSNTAFTKTRSRGCIYLFIYLNNVSLINVFILSYIKVNSLKTTMKEPANILQNISSQEW